MYINYGQWKMIASFLFASNTQTDAGGRLYLYFIRIHSSVTELVTSSAQAHTAKREVGGCTQNNTQ